jgi:hypothetical protein
MLFLPVVVAICFPMGQKRYLSGMWHCDAVRALVAAERPSLICLQETKRVVSSDFDLKQFIGPGFDYSYLPADGTRGGILAAWKSAVWVGAGAGASSRRFSLSVRRSHAAGGSEWWFWCLWPFYGWG